MQSFAILEVAHVLLRWVRSPVQTTAMQVASRLFLVWGIAEQFPEVRFFCYPRIVSLTFVPPGPLEPAIHEHGAGVVYYRDCALLILRVQPLRKEPICASVAAVHGLLCTLPPRRRVGGVPHLRHPPVVIPHSGLASVAARNVEAH